MLFLAHKQPQGALRAIGFQVEALGALFDEGDVLSGAVGGLLGVAGGDDYLFLILQELFSIVSRFSYWCHTTTAFKGTAPVGGPGRGGAGRTELGWERLFAEATLLFFDVNSTVLVIVFEE